MQNIDFSPQIRKNNRSNTETPSGAGNVNKSNTSNTLFSNRWISFSFALLFIIFSLGFYAGLRIGTFRQIETEDCIVRYPDSQKAKTQTVTKKNTTTAITQKEATTSLSNTGTTQKTTYIIKVGSFKSNGAKKLTQQLNNISKIRKLKPTACKGVKEDVTNRGATFRMADTKILGNENVLVGCFHTATRANHILKIVQKSGLPGSSKSELYEY